MKIDFTSVVEFIKVDDDPSEEERLSGPEYRETSEDGFLVAVYNEPEDTIYVMGVLSSKKGFMREALCRACKRFGTDLVEFANVLDPALVSRLRNIVKSRVFFYPDGSETYNVRVRWVCENEEK